MDISRALAVKDLVGRYGAVFSAAWSARKELDARPRQSHEIAFLPANLELIESPVHPAPRWAMRTLVAMAFAILAITVFGKLDIVVGAKGKLLPNARVKVIQPAITGVVKAIQVRDGQRVVANQLLMELDTSQASADSDKAREARLDAGLSVARARALLDAQTRVASPIVAGIEGASSEEQLQAQRLAEGLYHEYRDKQSSAQAELQKREADLQTTKHEITKLQATAPLAREQADDYRALVSQTYVAKHEYLSKEQSAIEEENELHAQQSHADQLRASVQQQNAEIASLSSQFRREQLDLLTRANQQLSQMRDDETKARIREGLLSIKAPVAGVVQQLATHTIGGVVTAAQTLMIIVPDDAVEVEASIENKDIGFVKIGQNVTVKVDAFPYTRFGYLKGKVESLSSDAVPDKKLGLTYVAHIHLASSRMRINDQMIDLTPGMEVTAEINTGERSVAHYFLDPLVQTAQESMRER